MAKLKVDGKEIEVPDHFTLLQACEEAGAEVPRFCFHERLYVFRLSNLRNQGLQVRVLPGALLHQSF